MSASIDEGEESRYRTCYRGGIMEWREWKWVVTVLALAAFATLAGCSKNDKSVGPGDTSDIIGTWNLTGMTSRVGDQVYEASPEAIKADPLCYVFESGGRGAQIYQRRTDGFRWSTKGSTLTIATCEESNTYTFAVTSSTLRLEFEIGDYDITHRFTRE
jgi:hypothetical protein